MTQFEVPKVPTSWTLNTNFSLSFSGSLREDLQRVLQEHEGQKSSSSSTSTKEGKPSSKDAPVVASASEKSAADVGTHVKIASPEVVDVDDTASPSPPGTYIRNFVAWLQKFGY